MSETFWWILGTGLLMSVLSLVGGLTFVIGERTFKRLVHHLVSLAAGSLLGGAFLHMLPVAVQQMGNGPQTYLWVLFGFTLFLALEQGLHWHHCHREPSVHHKAPQTYLVLIADLLHNFIDGVSIAAIFIVDIHVGLMAWTAVALHEIPQELGDLGVLVHGGWRKREALIFNFLSSLTFPLAGVLVYFTARNWDLQFLVPFAVGNFIYIAAADLVPEIKRKEKLRDAAINLFFFILGIGILFLVHEVLADRHDHARQMLQMWWERFT